jgi:hypothetical protein
MRTQKITKAFGAAHIAMTLIDRGQEEKMLLERWAASDSARSMDDSDWDDSLDRFEIASVAAGADRFS